MNTFKRTSQFVGILSWITLAASEALAAGTCRTQRRNFAVLDTVTVTCADLNQTSTADVGVKTNGQGFRTITVNFISGAAGKSATTQGLDANGNALAGCSLTDSTAGGAELSATCTGTIAKWIGQVDFN